MAVLVVNNTNIVIETAGDQTRNDRRKAQTVRYGGDAGRRQVESQRRKQIADLRARIQRVVCSAVWAEDCLFRGASYAPDFKCNCALCRSEFPDRLHPRHSRESAISSDCQVESCEDPDLAEEIAKLRNDRPRIGSVYLGVRRSDRGSGESRRFRRDRD